LNDTHFDAFLKHFRAALDELGVKAGERSGPKNLLIDSLV
jgi:truncated hemoglobin YjbI